MAGLIAIVRAVARALARDLRSLNSLAGNNFFIFFAVLFGGVGSGATPFLALLLGSLLLFPLAADPLRKVPPERLALWPLSPGQLTALRIAAIAMNPATWLTLGLLVLVTRAMLALQFAAVVIAGQFAFAAWSAAQTRVPQLSPFRWIPALPGVTGGLVRKNLREFLSLLDPYLAILLASAGAGYVLLVANAEPEAAFGMTLLVTLALSTCAQCLFALDGAAGLTRYRLWPIRGWTVLFAKDLAFLSITVVLCLPLRPLAGLAAALMALAIGHHVSVRNPLRQTRWRFTGGSLGLGIGQVFGMFSAATLVDRTSIAILGPCAIAWAASLWLYGRSLNQ